MIKEIESLREENNEEVGSDFEGLEHSMSKSLYTAESAVRHLKEHAIFGEVLREKVRKLKPEIDKIAKKLGIDEGENTTLKIRKIFAALWNDLDAKRERGTDLQYLLNHSRFAPQDRVNGFFRAESFFDREGVPCYIGKYLRERYSSLAEVGVEVDVDMRDLSEILKSHKGLSGESDLKEVLERYMNDKRNAMIPVLVLSHTGGFSTEIPIIYGGELYDKGSANGSYSYLESLDTSGVSEDLIRIKDLSKSGKSIIELQSTLLHEIDHAIFHNLYIDRIAYMADERSKIKALLKDTKLGEEREILEKKDKALDESVNRLRVLYTQSKKCLSEGLARLAQKDFLSSQCAGIQKESDLLSKEDIQKVFEFYSVFGVLLDQSEPQMVLYALGWLMVNYRGDTDNITALYATRAFEKTFLENPEIPFHLIAELTANLKENRKLVNEIDDDNNQNEQQLLHPIQVQLGLTDAGIDAGSFMVGEQYHGFIKDTARERNLYTQEDLVGKVKELLSKYPNLQKFYDMGKDKLSPRELYAGAKIHLFIELYLDQFANILINAYDLGELTETQIKKIYADKDLLTKTMNVPNFNPETGELLSSEQQVVYIKETYGIAVPENSPYDGHRLSPEEKILYMKESYRGL
ncbi:MAG: hypothetical protein PHU71_02710 [Candidatus Gracilibacteria bacterium]|nr:hypothetical protein [Candidatus Gracilibacteria bacterium]